MKGSHTIKDESILYIDTSKLDYYKRMKDNLANEDGQVSVLKRI